MSQSAPLTIAPEAIVLAAGKGTRMGGDQPKVLYEAAGKPLVRWVVEACRAAGCDKCVLIVGYQADRVRAAFAGESDVLFAEQIQQLGTGHAAMMAAPHFDNEAPVDVFVLAGDMPLIRPATLQKLLEAHRRTGAAVSLATAVLDDPTGYGRILRDDQGRFQAIVEEKDASEAQRAIREVNPSFYCFRSDRLFEALSKVDNRNQQGEFYLTDAPGQLARMGHTVTLLDEVAPEEAAGVNTPRQLEAAEALMRERQDATG